MHRKKSELCYIDVHNGQQGPKKSANTFETVSVKHIIYNYTYIGMCIYSFIWHHDLDDLERSQ